MQLKDTKPGDIITFNTLNSEWGFVYNIVLSKCRTGVKVFCFDSGNGRVDFLKYDLYSESSFQLVKAQASRGFVRFKFS